MRQPDRLTCEELFRRLDDYMDRELDPAEATLVREHLETCVVCAAEYSFETSMLTSVRDKLRHIAAPPDLLAKISARLARANRDGSA
jgi:anti-sigma factor (TIGR02949 family)